MAKGYLVSVYHSINDADKMAAYAKLAAPALQAGGGRFLVRGVATMAYESGLKERTVIVEFDSVEKAIAAHDSPAYQAALKALDNGAVRDMRIVEGVA